MRKLIQEINKLKKTEIKNTIDKRLKEFESFQKKPTKQWFSELCFCLLTANSKAKTAIKIQDELGIDGFCNACFEDVKNCIIKNKHRFHNNKSKFIVNARSFIDIKKRLASIKEEKGKREFLVKNIKGLGFKEASHFLRNTGHKNLAIVDRHVINLLLDYKIIKEKPSSITKNLYEKIEQKLEIISTEVDMSQAELDLYLWYMKTGKILK